MEKLPSRVVNDTKANEDQGFATNEVITSKYMWWNFLPIFLWENLNPFNKFANFYFVCVAICEVGLNAIENLILSVFRKLPSPTESPNPSRLSYSFCL